MEDFKGKRLLILGGATQSKKVVTAAKEMGVHAIVLDINKDAPAKEGADECVEMSLMDYDAILEWCRQNPVDGIINISVDFAQKTFQFLCEKLGLPCFGNAEIVRALTDKMVFKKLCQENGLDVIPEYTEEDIQNGRAEYPLFVKPAESSGSRGGCVCQTKEEALAAISADKDISRNGKVIIEKYMGDKPDFMVAYVFIDGKAYIQRTADRYHGKPEDGLENVGALAVSPSIYTDLYIPDIHGKFVNMIKKLGMVTGTVFSQAFLDGDTFRFYDPAIRLPGASFENILKAATGLDVVKMFVEYALSGKVTGFDPEKLEKAYELNGKYGAIAFPMVRPGKIESVLGLEEILADPRVLSSTYRHGEGDTVKKTGDVTQRFGEFDVLVGSREELRDVLKMIQKELVVLDENGEDLIISKPDLEQI